MSNDNLPAGSDELVPAGSLVWAIVTVRPHNLDQGLVLVPSKSTEGNKYLDIELTVCEGQYARRKVWDRIDLDCSEGMAAVRHILEVGREMAEYRPDDPRYRLGIRSNRNGEAKFMELNGLRCAVKVGVEESPGYPAKNRVLAYLSPNPASDTHKNFQKLVEGVTPEDRAVLRRDFELWQAAHLRAGFKPGDHVGVWPRTAGNDDPPAARVPLSDVEGIAAAYLAALLTTGTGGFTEMEEWRVTGRAIVAMIDGPGRRASAVLTADSSDRSLDYQTSRGFRLDVSADGTRLMADRGDDGAFDPLAFEPGDIEPEYLHRVQTARAWAGLSAVFKMAGGVFGVTGGTNDHGDDFTFVFRVGILPRALAMGGAEEATLRGLCDADRGDAFQVGALSLAHLRRLGAGREPVRAAAVADDLALHLETLLRAAQMLKNCGGSYKLLFKLPGFKPTEALAFILPGYIPARMLSLLVGAAGAGKSTLLHDLAIIVGTPRALREPGRKLLGVPVENIAHGAVVFLSGEDNSSIILERKALLEGVPALESRSNVMEWPSDGLDLTATLAQLESIVDLVLLIVDPARKFIKGSEDESASVDAFMSELERFASTKGCAVVIAHHLRRNAKPATPAGTLEVIRGSQLFIDRPRAVVAMAKHRGGVSVAVVKHNIPPTFAMMDRAERFALDDVTLRLSPFSEAASDRTAPRAALPSREAGDENEGRVVEAVRQAALDGLTVTRTGRHGIFERGLPGLAGMTRVAARAATGRAIASNALRIGDGGVLAVAGSGPLPALPTAQIPLPATAAMET